MEKVIALCHRKGVVSGTFVRFVEEAQYWIDRGVRYLMLSTDAGLLLQVSRERLEGLRKLCP
jgi:2-keto-3-deoxy-L-rhamnonate aldolase RhmA